LTEEQVCQHEGVVRVQGRGDRGEQHLTPVVAVDVPVFIFGIE
jgi:hypothetical protein